MSDTTSVTSGGITDDLRAVVNGVAHVRCPACNHISRVGVKVVRRVKGDKTKPVKTQIAGCTWCAYLGVKDGNTFRQPRTSREISDRFKVGHSLSMRAKHDEIVAEMIG